MAQTTNSRRDLHTMISAELEIRLLKEMQHEGITEKSAMVARLLKEALDARRRLASRKT